MMEGNKLENYAALKEIFLYISMYDTTTPIEVNGLLSTGSYLKTPGLPTI
jgi:hypothetical protein